MNRDITKRLQAGERFLLDGATGSELQRRKVDLSAGISEDGNLGIWSATALRDAPDQVRAVHEDYLRVGTQIITTNSFWTNPGRLALAGLADQWEAYTRLAGELAVAARDELNPAAFVAGGMAPPGDEHVFEARSGELVREFGEQARVLAETGVDLMLPEYVGSVADCVASLDACAPTGLPVFLGLRHITEQGDMQTGETFEQLVEAIGDRRVDAILVMCSMPEPTTVGLAKLRAAFDGPVGAYAHIGYDPLPQEQRRPGQVWHELEAPDYPPERFAGFGREWLDIGAQIIGGCCATTPDHIAALRRLF